MRTVSLQPHPHPDLSDELVVFQQYGLDLTVNPDSAPTTLVHVWDAKSGKRAERRLAMSPREAHAAGHTVVPQYPPTTVTVDLDAPESPVDGVPPEWREAWRAADVLGLTVVVAESGTVRHGVRSHTAVVVAHTAEHAVGYLRLLEVFTGKRGLARVGACNRTLLSWRDKPQHSETYAMGGVLGEGGAPERRTVAELRVISATPSYVPAAQVAALLAVNGVRERVAGPVPLPDGDGTVEEMAAVLARPRQGGRPCLLDVAQATGAGYNSKDPDSRHQGEMAVITALVRAGYGVGAIQDFLTVHAIGDRMRKEHLEDGRIVLRRPSEQRNHVKRAVRAAAQLVASTGGMRTGLVATGDVAETLTAAWAIPMSHDQRVAFAVLATVAARHGRLDVQLGQLDLELLVGFDGADAMDALRSHPCVDVAVPGSFLGSPTTWRITAPRVVSVDAPVHAPSWEAVAEAAGSPVVAGGGVGNRYHPHTALVLATIRDIALKRGEIAEAIGSTPERVGRVLERLAEADLTKRQPGARHRLVMPLWVGAMATGTAEHGDRKRATVADRREKRRDVLEGLREAHQQRSVALAGDPGVADAWVFDDLVMIEADDPRAPLVAAYIGDPDDDGSGPVHPGVAALVEHAIDAAGGQLDMAAHWMRTASQAVEAWVVARAGNDVTVASSITVALQVLARLLAVGVIDDAALAAVAVAGGRRTHRIDWPAKLQPRAVIEVRPRLDEPVSEVAAEYGADNGGTPEAQSTCPPVAPRLTVVPAVVEPAAFGDDAPVAIGNLPAWWVTITGDSALAGRVTQQVEFWTGKGAAPDVVRSAVIAAASAGTAILHCTAPTQVQEMAA